jgi:hypothetical protein
MENQTDPSNQTTTTNGSGGTTGGGSYDSGIPLEADDSDALNPEPDHLLEDPATAAVAPPASVTSSDDWSRLVSPDVDAALTTTPSSVLEGFTSLPGSAGGGTTGTALLSRVQEEDGGGGANIVGETPGGVVPHPPPPLSRKEAAIARERQRRMETERARFKQRFVNTTTAATAASTLSSTGSQENHIENNTQDSSGRSTGGTHPYLPSYNNNNTGHSDNYTRPEAMAAAAAAAVAFDSSSVAETIEATMVHPDDEQTANPELQLGFNMERFLRNSQHFQPEAVEATPSDPHATPSNNNMGTTTSNVLMERFLQETPVLDTSVTQDEDTTMNVEEKDTPGDHTLPNGNDVLNVDSNRSTDDNDMVGDDDDDGAGGASGISDAVVTDHSPPGHNRHPSTVDNTDASSSQLNMTMDSSINLMDTGGGGLTQRVLQAMEAMEETSIANAPPSEREELDLLSEVGELPDDFVTAPPTDTTAVSSDRDRHSETTPLPDDIGGGAAGGTTTTTTPPILVPGWNRPSTPPMSNQSQQGGFFGTPAQEDRTMNRGGASSADDEDDNVDPDDVFTPPWSPPGKMNVSPLHTRSLIDEDYVDRRPNFVDFGMPIPPMMPSSSGGGGGDGGIVDPLVVPTTPLDVPPEIITTKTTSTTIENETTPLLPHGGGGYVTPRLIEEGRSTTTITTNPPSSYPCPWGMLSPTSPVWNDIPTKLNVCVEQSAAYVTKKSDVHHRIWVSKRAMMVVFPTVVLVGPTLWILQSLLHGSICQGHVPLSRVVTWIALLPIHLAMSRQLQMGTNLVTLHGIGFRQITGGTSTSAAQQDWKSWVWSEMGTTLVLGLECGILMLVISWLGTGGGGVTTLPFCLVAALTQVLCGVCAGVLGCYTCVWHSWISARNTTSSANTSTAATIYDTVLPLGISLQDLVSTTIWMLVLRYVLADSSASISDDESITTTTGASLWMTDYCN